MRYVKIYNKNLMPIGVVDASSIQKAEGGERFVKVKGSNMIPLGAVNIDADIASLDLARLVDVYDENMLPFGCADVLAIVPQKPTIEWVDLGLQRGTLWANMNLGAEKETDAGLYFSWGNVQGHTANENYNFMGVTGITGSEHFVEPYASTTGASLAANIPATDEYDAARYMLGGNARIPTFDEFHTLFLGTNRETVSDYKGTGVSGVIFRSKYSENSIFLPFVGLFSGQQLTPRTDTGFYITSTIGQTRLDFTMFDFLNIGKNYMRRPLGMPIRPVK